MNLLFIYGTLLFSTNEYGLYLKKNSKLLGIGAFRGRLYDIGEYPGAVYDPSSTDLVYGTIVELENAAENFKVIDKYEGFGKDQAQPNEFVRTQISIELDLKGLTCWTYLYNLPITSEEKIESGNYIKFLNERA
jgi:gamma-glutamylcyclotransferase (GGCT)/AIG2-like uncharacterized protein YtfP